MGAVGGGEAVELIVDIVTSIQLKDMVMKHTLEKLSVNLVFHEVKYSSPQS